MVKDLKSAINLFVANFRYSPNMIMSELFGIWQ